MAGHSKWANIKHRKESQDSKKAKVFTRRIKEIMVATQQGGPQPETNSRLRLAIQNAKSANIPKENILRAIKKASSTEGGTQYTKMTYEGYASHGVGVVIETMTDNTNRTVADIRALFNKYGGSLDKKGAIKHLFDYKGIFCLPTTTNQEWDALTMELLEVGIEEMEEEEGYMYITCAVEDFHNVQCFFEQRKILPEEARLTYIPQVTTTLPKAQQKNVNKLLDALVHMDDVQHVYHTLALSK